MPTIKTTSLLIILLFLQACTKQQFLVKGINSEYQGVLTHSININWKDDAQQILLICFSEINDKRLIGISCQNDTGFHLFSGGMKGADFTLEKVSQFVLKIDSQTIVSYMKIALFSEYKILHPSKLKLKIDKDIGRTRIYNNKNQRIVEINLL